MITSYFSTAASVAQLNSELKSWEGTPFLPRTAVKGKGGGVDCAQFVYAVFRECGACVVYDFVTDTEAGAVTCAEWITLDEDGRIATVELLFEKAEWAHVIEALRQRG